MLLFILIAVLSIIPTAFTTYIGQQSSSYILTRQHPNTINITDALNRMVVNITGRDPYINTSFEGDFLGFGIVKMENLTIRGFSNLEVAHINLVDSGNTSSLGFIAKVNNLTGSCDNWTANNPILWGSGRFDFCIGRIKMNVTAVIDNAVKNITAMTQTTKFKKPNVTVTGLYNNQELSDDFNAMWNKMLKLCPQEIYTPTQAMLHILQSALQYVLLNP